MAVNHFRASELTVAASSARTSAVRGRAAGVTPRSVKSSGSVTEPSGPASQTEWDNLQKARQFAQSDDLRNTMQRAGVVGKPEVYFLEELERPMA
jgi:hypothetical protein